MGRPFKFGDPFALIMGDDEGSVDDDPMRWLMASLRSDWGCDAKPESLQ